MKLNAVKILFAVALGALLGYLCKIIVNDANEWCSFGVGAVTIIGSLVMALASYPDFSSPGALNTKLLAWMMAVIIIVSNFIFAFINYRQDTYIVILALILIVDCFFVYLMAHKSRQKNDKK